MKGLLRLKDGRINKEKFYEHWTSKQLSFKVQRLHYPHHSGGCILELLSHTCRLLPYQVLSAFSSSSRFCIKEKERSIRKQGERNQNQTYPSAILELLSHTCRLFPFQVLSVFTSSAPRFCIKDREIFIVEIKSRIGYIRRQS